VRSFFLFFSLFLINCNNSDTIELDINDKIILPKHYIVNKINDQINIDGRDDELAWNNAIYTDDFIDIEGSKIPSQKTNVKMLWDEKFLYVFAKLYENHIWGDITKRDEVIYYNNDFEVFINPNDDVFSYGEIEINALGTEWDLFLNRPYRLKGKADSSWDINGLKSAVDISGTLNDPNDLDDYWTVEIAIPLKEIEKLNTSGKDEKVISGDIWRINFSRVNWDFEINNGVYSRKKENGKYLPEYNWVWSPQGIINMHVPENWGYLVFSENDEVFNMTNKLITQHILYTVFREISFGNLKYLKNLEANTSIEFKDFEYRNIKISCNFLKTEDGYIIELNDDEYNFSIDETGKIKN
tara:strand:- start:430 stop:1494 length:1065 start_codon:yes stop_codon:yes gene_type:complete